MRIGSCFLRVTAALAALASTLTVTNAIKNCADCPGDKTCILEDMATTLTASQSTLVIKFCHFDTSKSSDYTIDFSLSMPLECDPNGTLVPKVKLLKARDGCADQDCTVDVTLDAPLDWAILMLNDGKQNILQAKLSSATDENTTVQVATGSIGGAAVLSGNGKSSSTANVCTAQFGVSVSRLSRLVKCNAVKLCLGKPSDTACTTPLVDKKLMVSGVECKGDSCTGKVAVADSLPCTASTGDNTALIMSVTVGNSGASNYAKIATLSAAPAATISSVDNAEIGSGQLLVKSDATCPQASLAVKVSSLPLTGWSAANGSIIVSLAKPLTSSTSKLDISVTQCGVASKTFSTAVQAASEEDAATSKDDGGDSINKGNSTSGGQKGSTSTQKDAASTGLPFGTYIAIGVGGIAVFGFLFECWYHKRRHHEEHGPRGDHHQHSSARSGAGHMAV